MHTGAWEEEILKLIQKERGDGNLLKFFPEFINGQSLFGLVESTIKRMMESVSTCVLFRIHNFPSIPQSFVLFKIKIQTSCTQGCIHQNIVFGVLVSFHVHSTLSNQCRIQHRATKLFQAESNHSIKSFKSAPSMLKMVILFFFAFQLPGIPTIEKYNFRFGRTPILIKELPLALNPSGCIRSERFHKHRIRYGNGFHFLVKVTLSTVGFKIFDRQSFFLFTVESL